MATGTASLELVDLDAARFQSRITSPVSDPRKEFVAPLDVNAWRNRVLPIETDDVAKQLSSNIYSQMRCDPEIAKCLTIMVIGTLGDGHQLLPAYPEKVTPTAEEKSRYEKSLEVRDFCNRNFNGLRRPPRQTWEDMLMGALTYGNKVSEIVWKIPDTGEDAGKLMLDALKVKNRKNLRFVVDRFFNILGFINANSFDYNAFINAAGMIPIGKFTISESAGTVNLNGAPLIPREKFAVLAMRVEDEDPRGRSFLRAAFNSWHLKRETFPQYLRYLMLSALPLLIGILPDGEGGKQLLKDLEGNYEKDAEGRYIEVSPTDAFALELMKLRDGSVMAAKGGTEIKLVEAKGDGSAFYKSFEMFDRQMEMSLLLQTLATSESKYNTRAAAVAHMTVLDQMIWWLKGCMVDMITNDMLKPMVRYNYGDDMLEFTPIIHFGDTERRDFAKDGLTIAALMRANFFDASQMKALDAQLGAPIRDVTLADVKKQMDTLLQMMKPNNATQLSNGSVSNPAARRPGSTAKFPTSGRPKGA